MQPARGAIPQRDGEHADTPAERPFDSPGGAGFEQHLGVGLAPERYAGRFEPRAQPREVVDLAVAGDHERAAGGHHGLAAARREIDDGEAPVSERNSRIGVGLLPRVVGAARFGEPLARYQPTLRYFLLDEGACQDDDLPRGNLVTALIGFENSRSPEALGRIASALPEWLRGPGEPELKRAFLQWALRVVMPAGFRSENLSLILPQLEEDPTMLAEQAKEWYEEALERGIERGRAEERALLCRQAARKFDAGTAERLSGLLDRFTVPGQLGEVGDWIIECGTGADLLARAERMLQPSS